MLRDDGDDDDHDDNLTHLYSNNSLLVTTHNHTYTTMLRASANKKRVHESASAARDDAADTATTAPLVRLCRLVLLLLLLLQPQPLLQAARALVRPSGSPSVDAIPQRRRASEKSSGERHGRPRARIRQQRSQSSVQRHRQRGFLGLEARVPKRRLGHDPSVVRVDKRRSHAAAVPRGAEGRGGAGEAAC